MPRGHGRCATPLLSPLLSPGHKHRHGHGHNSLLRTLAIGATGAVVVKTLMDKK